MKDVDYIVTSLPKTSDVENVLTSSDGIFDNAAKGTVIVDTSTISPMFAKEFSATARDVGMTFCDSPMSGGIFGATN